MGNRLLGPPGPRPGHCQAEHHPEEKQTIAGMIFRRLLVSSMMMSADHRIESNRIDSNRIESNRIESNRIESIESN